MEQASSGQPFNLNDTESVTVEQLKTSDLRPLGENVKLLAVIQNLSHELVVKSENTYKKLDEIQCETEVIAESEFIENRLYEDDETDLAPEENSRTSPDQKIQPIIHECISNSLKFTNENFTLEEKQLKQTESDDEDDCVKETLERAMESKPTKAPLPAIIGSHAFFNQSIFNDDDGDDDNVSSICSTASGESEVVSCNSSTGNLLLGMTLNRHGINESSSPLHNDPFLSFTDGLGGLVSDNYLCSLSSSSSSSSSPSNFYISSSRLTSSSPDFTLTSGSIARDSHQLITKRPSSLCDSPPPSSCNSTLTSDLDLCGSFAPDDEDEFDSLGGRSGCGRGSDQTSIIQRHYDDEFPLLPNDESIWDTFIHSNDINDMINSDELLSSPTTHFPIDDYRLISVIKDNASKSSSSSSSLTTTTTTTTPIITTNNSISSSPSSLSSSSSSSSSSSLNNNFSNGGSHGSTEINNSTNDGANESFLLNSNLAMLLQGKETSFKNCYTLTNGANCNNNNKPTITQSPSSQYQQHHQQQSAVAIVTATASRNRFHNYSASLPKTPFSCSTSTSSSSTTTTTTSTSPSIDNNRINSNYVIVQKNRATIKTSSNHSNGTKDIIKSAQYNLQNCDMSRNEIDRKPDYFTLDSEMKKYRTMADSVYSKLGPSYVKISRKLAYNSSSSSSSSSSMPSPKRAYLPSKSSMENNYKRMKLPSTLPSMQGTSVLMNLLVNGEDVTNGYSRFQQQSHLKNNSINVNIG